MLDVEKISKTLRKGEPILIFDEVGREGETDIFFFCKTCIKFKYTFFKKKKEEV